MKPKATKSRKGTNLKSIGRAFRSRNYRLFFVGQSISLIGTWMQQIAMSWLVYRLTNSALLLGLIGFTGQIRVFLLTSFAGVFADRVRRRHLLIITQSLAAFQALLLAFLVLSGYIQVWHLILLSLFLGSVNAVDMPTRQSFVVEMVEHKKDLGNAIALNSFMFNSARLVGPSVAGLVVGLVGEGLCFLINGISFAAIIITLLAMKMPKQKAGVQTASLFRGLKEGYRYAFGFPPILYVLLLMALINLVGMPYVVLMPVFARDILHGGPQTLGFLMGASGVGALVAALYLASRRSVLGLVRLIMIASSAFGMGLVAFSSSRYLSLSLGIMFFFGIGMIASMASTNTIVQTIVDEDKRGRVMGLYTMTGVGMAPFGSLMAGGLANRIGAPESVAIGGIVCILGSLFFLLKLPLIRKSLRPIYAKMGIVREVPPDIGP
jgi:MFS family permease